MKFLPPSSHCRTLSIIVTHLLDTTFHTIPSNAYSIHLAGSSTHPGHNYYLCLHWELNPGPFSPESSVLPVEQNGIQIRRVPYNRLTFYPNRQVQKSENHTSLLFRSTLYVSLPIKQTNKSQPITLMVRHQKQGCHHLQEQNRSGKWWNGPGPGLWKFGLMPLMAQPYYFSISSRKNRIPPSVWNYIYK